MNNELPLVCICIPTYNAATTILETLQSILAQTYSNLVIHVSDNASTDDTLKLVEPFAGPRVIIHRHAENVGGEGNFNRCIQYAEGKYTAIYHADDIYEPDMVQQQVEFLEQHAEAGAVFTEASLIDENSHPIGSIGWPKNLRLRGPVYDFPTLFKAVLRNANFFICPSVMARTSVYQQEIKIWRGEMFGSGADLDVWLRILQRHPVGLIAKPLMRYRLSASQFSARVRAETGKAIIFRILDYYLEQGSVKVFTSAQDWRNYARLERRDRVARAINFFILGNPQEARVLCHDIFSWDAISAAFGSKRGLVVFIAGSYVWLLVVLGLSKFGKSTLSYAKRMFLK